MRKTLASVVAISLSTAFVVGCSCGDKNKPHPPKPPKGELTKTAPIAAPKPAVSSTINLYQEPNDTSKVIDQISPAEQSGFVPIHKNKDGWVKVGNQANGETGWVKPITDRVEQLKAALIDIEQQQRKLAIAYQREVIEARRTEENIIRQINQSYRYANVDQPSIQKQFKSVSVSYNGTGDNAKAKVTKTWTDKDGKIQSKTEEVPLNQLNQVLSN